MVKLEVTFVGRLIDDEPITQDQYAVVYDRAMEYLLDAGVVENQNDPIPHTLHFELERRELVTA